MDTTKPINITKEMLLALPTLQVFPKDPSHPFSRWVASGFFGLDPLIGQLFGGIKRFASPGIWRDGKPVKEEYADLATMLSSLDGPVYSLAPTLQFFYTTNPAGERIRIEAYLRYDERGEEAGFCYVDSRWDVFLTKAMTKLGMQIRQCGKGHPIEIYRVENGQDLVYGYVLPYAYQGSETKGGKA